MSEVWKRILRRGVRVLMMAIVGALGGAYAVAQVMPPGDDLKPFFTAIAIGAVTGGLAAFDKAVRDWWAAITVNMDHT